MREAENTVIDVRGVKKIYRVGSVSINALNGVDLTISRGELCCIIGRSGSGKSTLLNVLAGLEKPTSGEIVIARNHIEKMTQSELIMFRQKHVGFIFQSFNLMPYYTALENVALPMTFRGVSKRVREKKARAMLKAVGLGDHMNHKPTQMSGGQQQRVGIARALVSDPEIVFADEPTGNLDSRTSDEVMRLICNITREQGKTLVMVTHDPMMAAFADKTVDILDGLINDIRIVSHDDAAQDAARPEEKNEEA